MLFCVSRSQQYLDGDVFQIINSNVGNCCLLKQRCVHSLTRWAVTKGEEETFQRVVDVLSLAGIQVNKVRREIENLQSNVTKSVTTSANSVNKAIFQLRDWGRVDVIEELEVKSAICKNKTPRVGDKRCHTRSTNFQLFVLLDVDKPAGIKCDSLLSPKKEVFKHISEWKKNVRECEGEITGSMTEIMSEFRKELKKRHPQTFQLEGQQFSGEQESERWGDSVETERYSHISKRTDAQTFLFWSGKVHFYHKIELRQIISNIENKQKPVILLHFDGKISL